MIENNPELVYPCRIIDFEYLSKLKNNSDESTEKQSDSDMEYIKDDEKDENVFQDFQSLGMTLPYILFGTYFCYASKKVSRKTKKYSKELFSERNSCLFYLRFSFVNKLMEKKLHRSYPEPILRRLAILIANLRSPFQEERSMLAEILEELQDMALADWDNGYYSIQAESK